MIERIETEKQSEGDIERVTEKGERERKRATVRVETENGKARERKK